MNRTPLAGQVAIVSGALGDIGRAVALRLAGLGASVALGDIAPRDRAESLLAELAGMGCRARYDRVDVSDAPAVDAWVGSAETNLGTPGIVVACAATVTICPISRMTPEQWRREIDVNLTGSFYLAQAAARRMLAARLPGRIVLVGSWAGHVPHAHIPAYSVSKAGLRMLGQCLALELAPAGILVNEIAPGFVDAGLSAAVFRNKPGTREAATRRVPTGGLITPDEVAEQVAYLCSTASRHTTGSVLLMDGGLSLGQPPIAPTNSTEPPR